MGWVFKICSDDACNVPLSFAELDDLVKQARRTNLSADEAEHAERLARVFATTKFVWNSEEDAQQFLSAPYSMLQGRTPLDVSMTELGARRVEELLWKLFYGIAA